MDAYCYAADKSKQCQYSIFELNSDKPDQMFHILAQACLTEKQFKFGFNRKTIVFVLCLTL